MLKKLLKYELRATARTMGGEYLAVLGIALLLGLTMQFGVGGSYIGPENYQDVSQWVSIAAIVLTLAYVAMLIAVVVLTVVTILQRFCRNLLGDEGYLMHTLPVTTRCLLGSKAIAAVLWVLIGAAVSLLSVLLLVMPVLVGGGVTDDLAGYIGLALAVFRQQTGLELPVFAAGVLVAAVCGVANEVLRVYAACMIGHQFKKWQVPAGILSYFALRFVQDGILGLLGVGGGAVRYVFPVASQAIAGGYLNLTVTVQFGTGVLLIVLPALVFGAAHFFLADWLLRTRLNLE